MSETRMAIVCPDCHGCGLDLGSEIGDTCPTCEGVGMVENGRTDGAGGEAVEDGFGNVALMCDEPGCDLHVVRPGKFQCNEVGPLCPNGSDSAGADQ